MIILCLIRTFKCYVVLDCQDHPVHDPATNQVAPQDLPNPTAVDLSGKSATFLTWCRGLLPSGLSRARSKRGDSTGSALEPGRRAPISAVSADGPLRTTTRDTTSSTGTTNVSCATSPAGPNNPVSLTTSVIRYFMTRGSLSRASLSWATSRLVNCASPSAPSLASPLVDYPRWGRAPATDPPHGVDTRPVPPDRRCVHNILQLG
jgi:hypothetical protein